MSRAGDLETVAPFLDAGHRETAAAAARFAAEKIAPLGLLDDDGEARIQAREILELLGTGGWCRYAVPAAFGGVSERVDTVACCLIREILAAVSPLADSVFALQCLGSLPIALYGTDEARRRWLPRVADGTAMAGFAMTEPNAGSDVRALETRAERLDDGYTINGLKTFITNAGLADFYSTFVRTSADGLSCLVVPADASGLRFVSEQVLSAPHPLGEIAFENCRVPSSALVGDEGEGFEIGMRTLDRLRATVAAAACGMAARALEEARRHAVERQQFGRQLSRFQLTQQKIARMATDLAASRLLTFRAARAALDGDADVTLRSAMSKYHATESAQRIVDDAVQILGGGGVLKTHPIDHYYRSVRALRIYEGTSEIQQLIVAREILRPGHL
ncbi:MAG: acyl-CoA dehydrogenase family protein [bacterium]|nr:acyl-CoA dehydrogenase family protein [bacterium]